ncbi:ABC transporter permease subunit [Paenibacillus sp.]|uniref:ABC transporter permease n=1 Tax=Paenibacillus sp. TaxID=58172 RepID=UPI002810ED47|nr:ABC transporter permease subunit [Paenibacillus sp.]
MQFVKRFQRDKVLYVLLIPFLLWYVFFIFKPMYGLQIAFKDFSVFRGIEASRWVGLEHFRVFFESPYFIRVLKNTLILSLYSLAFAFPIPIVLAILLNELRHTFYRRAVQTLTYLPHFISVVIVAGIVTNFLAPTSGLVNLLLERIGGEKMYFLTIPDYFRTIFVLTFDIWKEAGFSSIVYLAALAGINPQLYEAAVMDGANKFRQIWHITLPGLLPTIMILLIMKIGSIMDVSYEAIILLYQPVTYETADVISTYVYRAGLQEGRYDLATAVGVFNAAIAFALVIGANKLSKRLTDTGLW